MILGLLAMLLPVPAQAPDPYAEERARMVATIRAVTASAGIPGKRTLSPEVLRAMGAVPRHLFVPEGLRGQAHEDGPLPIGEGQTISQPFIVALMTDLLDVEPDDRVLEVGTGSGYQAAVLARLVREVDSIEIVEAHARAAAERLGRLGFRNVRVRHGDGYAGWPESAPYDAIIVTAGAEAVPPPLVAQLRPGGRMVIPVGRGSQELLVLKKRADGRIERQSVLPVSFVPFTRGGR